MKLFSAIPEPWAKILAVLVTSGLGIHFYLRMKPGFGIGMACGAVACMLIYLGLRLDERPFWQHVFGRSRVYPESKQDQDA